MDIWDWVFRLEDDLEEAGHEHASRIIEQVSTEILELNIGKAEALLPEAIALSRSLNNPWLEVYFKHWEMRNRIGNKSEGDSVLGDVVELFEFAHRDETITCPQSICVTQDLSACYANIDGPGWAEERKAVCDETFARIDPTWSCFHCLSCEYADALIDEGNPQQAFDYLQQQKAKIIAVGEEVSEAIKTFEVQALLRLNQNEQALAILEECQAAVKGYDWPVNSQERHILKALTLAKLGKTSEAWDELPNFKSVAPRYYLSWIRAIDVLLTHEPDKNEWALGSALQEALEHFMKMGNYRKVIEVAALQIRLAMARQSVWTAKRALAIANEALPKLKAPLGADQLLTELTNQIASQAANNSLPVPANELMTWLEERAKHQQRGRNPEQEIELLLQAVAELPDDEPLLEITVSALQACNATKEAEQLLWQFIERNHQHESSAAYNLLNGLISTNRLADIDKLAEFYQTSQPAVALWCKIQQAFAKQELDLAKTLSQQMHEIVPDYLGPVRMLVLIAVRQQDFAAAEKWQQLVIEKNTEDPRNDLWDLLTYSSANQNWSKAREVAKQLEIPLTSTEGVINEEWGWVRIQVEEQGDTLEYLAHCTGPVTAIIKEPAYANKTQRVDDWVVYDAAQLAPVPEDEEEKKHFIPLYKLVKTLQPGDFGQSWFIDGIYPGDEAFQLLEKQITDKGWRLWVQSNSNYQITDQFDLDETPQQGIFFCIVAPKAVTPVELDKFLTAATEDWALPVHWLKLAEAAGAAVEPHQEIISRYKL